MRDRESPAKPLGDTLTSLHEHFSVTALSGQEPPEYRRGHQAGMAFARLCVLDQLAAVSTVARIERGSVNRHRREQGALEVMIGRIDSERASNTSTVIDEFAEGYWAGLDTARAYIGLAYDALEIRQSVG